jgi:hypothetical protein
MFGIRTSAPLLCIDLFNFLGVIDFMRLEMKGRFGISLNVMVQTNNRLLYFEYEKQHVIKGSVNRRLLVDNCKLISTSYL